MVAVAASFRRHGPADRAQGTDRMLPSHLAALEARAQCRTEALGGPRSQGPDCGALEESAHACQHRHCPTCQHAAAPRWLAQQRARLLPGPDWLGTVTLPEALRPVARAPQRCLAHRRWQTSAAALQALALDPRDLGGPSGMVGGLHPWTRDLASHPHVHSLVPGGALSPEGVPWLSPRCDAWRVPVRALSTRGRGTGQAALTPAGLATLVPPQVWHTHWVTHCTPAGPGTEVLPSGAPCLSRSALTTNRLDTREDGHGTFRVTQRSGARGKRLTRPAKACIHRFLQQGLPQGCPTVRSDGVLRPRRRTMLPQRRTLVAACPTTAPAPASGPPRASSTPPPTPAAARWCRPCGGRRVVVGRLSPHPREPP